MVDIDKFITRIRYESETIGKDILEEYLAKYSIINTLFSSGQAVPFLFDFTNHTYPFFCNSSEKVLGFQASIFMTMGLKAFIGNLHPDDVNVFYYRIVPDFQRVRYSRTLTQVKKLRYTFNYRFKKNDNKYIHCLEQDIILETDKYKNPLLTFGTITDISEYKKDNVIIGTMSVLNSANEYETVYSRNYSNDSKIIYSNREMDIIRLLAKGLSSKEIGSKLNISPQTVDKHRRNMLHKAKMNNTQELVVDGIRQGWL
ncbi:MAG: response regulator transcription factor [Bacteroidales bacterium]|nr:response regulator transcription factor [Bacteroidales bacterium]